MHEYNNSCCKIEFIQSRELYERFRKPQFSITLIAFSGQFTSHARQAMQSFGFFTTAFFPSFANTGIGQTSMQVKHPVHFLESILG